MNFSYILYIHLTWFVEYIHFFLLILILKNIYFLKLNIYQNVLVYQIMFSIFIKSIIHVYCMALHFFVTCLYIPLTLPCYSKPSIDPLILTLIISLFSTIPILHYILCSYFLISQTLGNEVLFWFPIHFLCFINRI